MNTLGDAKSALTKPEKSMSNKIAPAIKIWNDENLDVKILKKQ